MFWIILIIALALILIACLSESQIHMQGEHKFPQWIKHMLIVVGLLGLVLLGLARSLLGG